MMDHPDDGVTALPKFHTYRPLEEDRYCRDAAGGQLSIGRRYPGDETRDRSGRYIINRLDSLLIEKQEKARKRLTRGSDVAITCDRESSEILLHKRNENSARFLQSL
jgi:hypothetical protein